MQLGVLWYPFWVAYAHECPEDHPSITQEEIAFIREGKQMHHLPHHTATAMAARASSVDGKKAWSSTENDPSQPLLVDQIYAVHSPLAMVNPTAATATTADTSEEVRSERLSFVFIALCTFL